MLIIIPTRIFPGIILGTLFIFAGFGAGSAGFMAVFHWRALRILHLICLPLFALATLYVCQAWRGRVEEHDAASRATFMSPRLLAFLLSVCLIVGLASGLLVAYVTQPDS